jgi:hypothetical protein
MPDLVKESIELCVDCISVHMKRGEWADAADVASELGAIFKARGNRSRADEMIRLQINAHIEGQEGNWALAAAKNDLVRLWKGYDKIQEALALHEVAKIYFSLWEPANVEKTGQEAIALLEGKELLIQVKILRTMMQVHTVDETKKDLKAAAKVAQECLHLGVTTGNDNVQAYGKLWQGRIAAEKFFAHYIPKITLWKNPSYTGDRNEKDLRLKDYEKSIKLIDDAYLVFERLNDNEGLQEAFDTALAIQQKLNSIQDPAKTIHIFKNGKYDHSEHSYDYAEAARETKEREANSVATLVE